MRSENVTIRAGRVSLDGDLTFASSAEGIVLFAHGSGSSRRSPRNRLVAGELNKAGLATLLFDLLTPEEESIDAVTAEHRFDIELLAERLVAATRWVRSRKNLEALRVGYFGASTGAAAALIAAAREPEIVKAVVSRGGRPDLAGDALAEVRAATLLIVGGDDYGVIELNESAYRALPDIEKRLEIVPGATHLFEEKGTLEEVASLARDWFEAHLSSRGATGEPPSRAMGW